MIVCVQKDRAGAVGQNERHPGQLCMVKVIVGKRSHSEITSLQRMKHVAALVQLAASKKKKTGIRGVIWGQRE